MRHLALVALALFIAACGSPAPEGSAPARNAAIVAVDAAPGSVAEANWRRFGDNVRTWAPEFTLDLRTGANAGTPAQRIADVQAGKVQVAMLPPESAVALVPELAVLSAPGLFASQDEADYVLDRVLLASFRPLFAAKGLRLLDWIDDDWSDPQAGRVYRSGVIVANKDWYDRLTPHDRDVFTQAYGSAGQARSDSRAAAGAATEADTVGPVSDRGAAGDHAALIGQAGGQSQQIYDRILQGRQDFAAQRGGTR